MASFEWELGTDGIAYLHDGGDLVGKWIYSEGAFHYYLNAHDSYGYPKPLPDGCPPPPPRPSAPTGNVGDGSFYGHSPSVETVPIPEGSPPMTPEAMPPPIPPAPPSGLWSTEFWYAVILTIGGLGAAFGLIPPGDVDTLTSQLKTVAAAGLGLAATIVPIWRYINGRVAVKTKQLDAAATQSQAVANVQMTALQLKAR
jgi:hypothetical protein